MIKSRILLWAGYAVRMGAHRGTFKVWIGKLTEKKPIGKSN